jgi:hypothetical protein
MAADLRERLCQSSPQRILVSICGGVESTTKLRPTDGSWHAFLSNSCVTRGNQTEYLILLHSKPICSPSRMLPQTQSRSQQCQVLLDSGTCRRGILGSLRFRRCAAAQLPRRQTHCGGERLLFPISVRFGEQDYQIQILTITRSRDWRAKLVEQLSAVLQNFETGGRDSNAANSFDRGARP